MFLHKNACSSLIYGPIFKIQLVPETREQALQDNLRIAILRICPNREIRNIQSLAKFNRFTVYPYKTLYYLEYHRTVCVSVRHLSVDSTNHLVSVGNG